MLALAVVLTPNFGVTDVTTYMQPDLQHLLMLVLSWVLFTCSYSCTMFLSNYEIKQQKWSLEK